MTSNRAPREELQRVYKRVLAGIDTIERRIDVGGHSVHVIEGGEGPALVMLHGTGNCAPFFQPLLQALSGVRFLAVDRPGQGLSDPIDIPRHNPREAVVAWMDRLLDALELESAALLGHSMGGLWSLWYALAHPHRVNRLALIAPPQLPGTRAPLPFRVMGTPGAAALLRRLAPPSRESVLQFAGMVGEGDTLAKHPDLVDLLVASGRDPVAAQADLAEVRAIISPLALVSRSGFRRAVRIRSAELRRLQPPTLLIWGRHDPLGDEAMARAVTDLIPDARLELLAAGHAPWLGHASRVAERVSELMRGGGYFRLNRLLRRLPAVALISGR